MLVFESQYVPNAEEYAFFNYITSSNFPWFYNEYDVTDATKKYPFFGHAVMNRAVDINGNHVAEKGVINSQFFPLLQNIFQKFCNQNGITYKDICRMNLNFNFHQDAPHSNIHIDHTFEHKNFIMYLSECSGDTIIFNDNDKIIASVKPELHKVVVFDGLRHAAGFCKPGEHRIVLVVTFTT
jgi:hypothetical protein